MTERIARARPRPILVGAWLVAVVYAYPGYLMTDSVEQLYQARSGHYFDWHPPLMARTWALVEHVVTGPVGMLAIQLGLLIAGVNALLRRRLAPGPAAVVTAAIALFPPVLTPMAVVWKDAQMAGFLAAGAALSLSCRRRDLALAAALLVLAAGDRYNAAAAVAPLALAAAHHHVRGRVRATAAGVAAALVLCGTAWLLNRELTDEETHPWTRSLAMLDIAGTIRYAGPLSDDEIRAELPGVPIHDGRDMQAHLRTAPNVAEWWFVTDGDGRVFDPPMTEAQRAAVSAAWWRLVCDHPIAWLEHRGRVFAATIGLLPRGVVDPVRHTFMELDEQRHYLHFDTTPSTLQRALAAIFEAIAATPLYRPIVYLLLAIFLVARRRRDYVGLLASGLAYEAGLFVVAPSPDFRYSHWMIVTALVAGCAAVAARVPAWRRPIDEPPPGAAA